MMGLLTDRRLFSSQEEVYVPVQLKVDAIGNHSMLDLKEELDSIKNDELNLSKSKNTKGKGKSLGKYPNYSKSNKGRGTKKTLRQAVIQEDSEDGEESEEDVKLRISEMCGSRYSTQ
jgi:hypothetical protein